VWRESFVMMITIGRTHSARYIFYHFFFKQYIHFIGNLLSSETKQNLHRVKLLVLKRTVWLLPQQPIQLNRFCGSPAQAIFLGGLQDSSSTSTLFLAELEGVMVRAAIASMSLAIERSFEILFSVLLLLGAGGQLSCWGLGGGVFISTSILQMIKFWLTQLLYT